MTAETYPNLRTADLIAKTARVTLKDTMRVILALQAVGELTKQETDVVIGSIQYDPSRPAPENVAACERAFYDMTEADSDRLDDLFDQMTELD